MSGLIELEGGLNFRDIGGYEGRSGVIRRGLVFRSGSLARLTPKDRSTIGALNIRLVCDFRGPEEQSRDPVAWLPPGAELADWGESSRGDITLLRKRVGSDATVAVAHDAMLELYRSLPYDHADRYGRALKCIAAGELPAILACTAGKDRTGTMVALLMALLDIPREAILANYALSDKYVDYVGHFRERAAAAERVGDENNPYLGLVRRVSAPVLTTLLASDPDYIAAGLAAVERDFGSVANFAVGHLGLSETELQQIRTALFE